MRSIFENDYNREAQERFSRRTGLYRSPEFCEKAKRLFDVQEMHLRNCIDALIEDDVIPHSDADPCDAVAKDAAALLAGLATRSDRASLLADTRCMLSMTFRLEFGKTAGKGRDGLLACDGEPLEDSFGAQLVRLFRNGTGSDHGVGNRRKPLVVAGKGPDRAECFGTIASEDLPGATKLYSTGLVFGSGLDPGIIRIVEIELDLRNEIGLTSAGMRSLVDIMLTDREMHLPPTSLPRP